MNDIDDMNDANEIDEDDDEVEIGMCSYLLNLVFFVNINIFWTDKVHSYYLLSIKIVLMEWILTFIMLKRSSICNGKFYWFI